MLTEYLGQLQSLIQAPSSPTPLVSTATQTQYINAARNQLAADSECVRVNGTLALSSSVLSYTFSQITLPSLQGYGSVIAVRSGLLGGQNLEIRPWEWFEAYYLGNPPAGVPRVVAQQGQGVGGTLFFSPIPNASLSVTLDCVCLPIALVDNTTPEAIPALWQDAVPFYAAWLAMQTLQRQNDAEAMLRRYQMLARRGRQFATPSELPDNLPGGIGAQLAAGRTTLGQPSAPPGR